MILKNMYSQNLSNSLKMQLMEKAFVSSHMDKQEVGKLIHYLEIKRGEVKEEWRLEALK